jgi:hypothetical protein
MPLRFEEIEGQARQQGAGSFILSVRQFLALQKHTGPFIVHKAFRCWIPQPGQPTILEYKFSRRGPGETVGKN